MCMPKIGVRVGWGMIEPREKGVLSVCKEKLLRSKVLYILYGVGMSK